MKTKKAFKMRKRQIISMYNYQIAQCGSFREFQKRLEKREEKLKLRHLKFQKKQVIAQNDNSKVLYFPLLEKVYLWNKRNLIKLPKVATDEWLAYSYLYVPPLD